MSEPATGPHLEERRSERRLRVRIPMGVRGTDRHGAAFEEKTFSEDLCRGGIAFALRCSVEPGTEVAIHLSLPSPVGRGEQTDFETRGQIRHVQAADERTLVGVAFTGPRLQRLFSSESA